MILSHPLSAPTGTKRVSYLEENVAAFSLQLSPQELRDIEEAFPPGVAAGERYRASTDQYSYHARSDSPPAHAIETLRNKATPIKVQGHVCTYTHTWSSLKDCDQLSTHHCCGHLYFARVYVPREVSGVYISSLQLCSRF